MKKDGTVDVPKEILRKLDVVIVAVHSHFHLGRKEMTERLIRAVEAADVDVLAHPTGRKIGERPPYEADWPEVFRRTAKAKTALEINANPQRLDLTSEHTRQAIEAGVPLIIGTDAHATEHLDFLELGVLTARRGWAQARHVLNTLPADEFLAACTRRTI